MAAIAHSWLAFQVLNITNKISIHLYIIWYTWYVLYSHWPYHEHEFYSLQWCHNECDGISIHQRLDVFLNRLLKSKKTSKLCITGLCEGNSSGTSEFPSQRASNIENVSIWWCHHDWWWPGYTSVMGLEIVCNTLIGCWPVSYQWCSQSIIHSILHTQIISSTIMSTSLGMNCVGNFLPMIILAILLSVWMSFFNILIVSHWWLFRLMNSIFCQ